MKLFQEPNPIHLRNQMCSFDELDYRLCQEVDDLWAEFGMDAAICFLMGA